MFGDADSMPNFRLLIRGSRVRTPTGSPNKNKHLQPKQRTPADGLGYGLGYGLLSHPGFTPRVLDSSQDFTPSTGYRTRPPILV